MIIFGVILLVIGIFHVFMPQKTLAVGRKYLYRDNKEPNVGAIFFTRMMGIFIVILSVYAIVRSF